MLTKMRMRLWILRRSAVLTCGDACPVSLREASTTSTSPRACMGMYFVSCIPCVPCRCEISVKMPDTGLTAPALAPLSQAGLAALMAHSLSLWPLSARHATGKCLPPVISCPTYLLISGAHHLNAILDTFYPQSSSLHFMIGI